MDNVRDPSALAPEDRDTSVFSQDLVVWLKVIGSLQAEFTVSVDKNGYPYCIDKRTWGSTISRWWNSQDRAKTLSLVVEKIDSAISLLNDRFDFSCYMLTQAAVGSFKSLALTYAGDKNDLPTKIKEHHERFQIALDLLSAKGDNAIAIADGITRIQQVSMFEPNEQLLPFQSGGSSSTGSHDIRSFTSSSGPEKGTTSDLVVHHPETSNDTLSRVVTRPTTPDSTSSCLQSGNDSSLQSSSAISSSNTDAASTSALEEYSSKIGGTTIGDPHSLNVTMFTYTEKPKRKKKGKATTSFMTAESSQSANFHGSFRY